MVDTDVLAGGLITLAFVEKTADGAATDAGYTNSTLGGPTISVSASAVPEPSSLILIGLGCALFIRGR